MAKSAFIPDLAAIALITSSPAAEDWALETAEAVAEQARLLAPERLGYYKRSIRGRAIKGPKGYYGVVEATDFKANWVELGTNGIKKMRVLGRALDKVGGVQTDGPPA